jgi:glycosyltransferase involved in cell wall biosynthesis
MKIAIIASSSWPVCYPIPHKSRSGDSFYACLAATLDDMGHEVSFFAPDGSYVPPHGHLYPMVCNWGLGNPSLEYCEQEALHKYKHILIRQDIVHDFSNKKTIADGLYANGYTNVLSTVLGGAWFKPTPPHNLVAVSKAQRDRFIRGTSDYENTPTPNMDTSPKYPVNDAHVVYLGVDTDFYKPTYEKKNFFLWLSRWHSVRGYKLAIELAKETGIELVIAGNGAEAEYQKTYQIPIFEAISLAKDIPNIHFEWLPDDTDTHHLVKLKLIQDAKAFLYPVQFNEPFGLMQAESLACGTPVIGTNYGSVPEIIEDGVTGYVVNNNIKDFANATTKIDNINPKICREHAVNRFGRHIMAMNYIQEYQKVIEGKHW